MPKFNFSKVTKPIEKTEEIPQEDNNKINSILYDYHVITSKKVDKTKTYYDAFFKSLNLSSSLFVVNKIPPSSSDKKIISPSEST